MTVKTYRLGSDPMCSAPGVLRWAISGAKFERDRAAMIRVISDGWGIPADAAESLLLQRVPYRIEGDTVVFTA